MAVSSTLLLAVYGLCCLSNGVSSAAVPGDSFTFLSHRQPLDDNVATALRKRQSGAIDSKLGKSLYWFAHFDVGESKALNLLVDTGSTDLIMNKGQYKKSPHHGPYGTGNFSISYEGVNRAGYGFETLNGTTFTDNTTAAGLTVEKQAMGQINTWKFFDVPQESKGIQGDGIIGFAGPGSSSFQPQANSWFFNLCKDKSISECRLGLVYGTSGKGLTVVGKLAKQYLKGDLVKVKEAGNQSAEYAVYGDVTLDNKIILKNQTFIMDVGTDNIQGPYGETKKILNDLGYQLNEKSGPNIFDPSQKVKTVQGYFACDKPPTLGFSFPAQAQLKAGEKSKIFNVSPKVWDVYDHGNNNCTSILGGTNALSGEGSGLWLLGQSFFAGHYVDFNIDGNDIAFGDLKDPSMANCGA